MFKIIKREPQFIVKPNAKQKQTQQDTDCRHVPLNHLSESYTVCEHKLKCLNFHLLHIPKSNSTTRKLLLCSFHLNGHSLVHRLKSCIHHKQYKKQFHTGKFCSFICNFHSKILPEGFHPHTQKSEPYKHSKNTTGKKIKLIQPNSCNIGFIHRIKS